MTNNFLAPIEPSSKTLGDEVADAVLAAFERRPELRQRLLAIFVSGGAKEWVCQARTESQLGSRRHIAAVKRLIAEGKPEMARIVGRKHFLRRDAYESELLRLGRMQVAKAEARETERDSLAEELGLEIVG